MIREHWRPVLTLVEEDRLFGSPVMQPKASVVVVVYNPDIQKFFDCLMSLKKQTLEDFEVIVVDNSTEGDVKAALSDFDLRYIKLNGNYGPSIGRNTGTHFAKADTVIFIDDDAIAEQDCIEQHLRAFEEFPKAVAVRGKAIAKPEGFFADICFGYDLGDEPLPHFVDLEGNASFKKDIFMGVGGFSSDIFIYGEGLELSYRIVKHMGTKNCIMYHPRPVIYHDPGSNLLIYLRKRVVGKKSREKIFAEKPYLPEFAKQYPAPAIRNRSVSFRVKRKILRILCRFCDFIGWPNVKSKR